MENENAFVKGCENQQRISFEDVMRELLSIWPQVRRISNVSTEKNFIKS